MGGDSMKVIGVTGGIGAGKSTVVNFATEHFPVASILTDEVAREQMKQGEIAYQRVIDHFGKDILFPDGEINRALLAKIVFANPDKVRLLNSLTHPLVKEEVLRRIDEFRQSGSYQAVLIETALLFDAGFDHICDETWFIDANRHTRKERLQKQRHYSNEKIEQIFESQNEEKAKKLSTHIIYNENNSSSKDLYNRLKQLLKETTCM